MAMVGDALWDILWSYIGYVEDGGLNEQRTFGKRNGSWNAFLGHRDR
jgi:hypothetical protein